MFDISDGMGLLVFNGLLTRDYPVVMGQVTVLALLLLIGNIVSDFLVALADPRVSYR
ncbi:MAG: ABC transporter permease subunit [Verrucomicrobiales bacterium]